ncbi:MAG: acetylxylan esterase [Armatimonadetes bacterium]|nr:acetylxylan esterase [Armatimonadota bacterium]
MSIRDLQQFTPGSYYYDVHDQLKNFVYRRQEEMFAIGDAARDALTAPEAVQVRQKAIREHFAASLGGLPPMGTPLEARTVGTVEGKGFHIEKIFFQSRPKHYVTANLYVPESLTGPRGAVLFLSGHHMEAKHVEEYQIICQYLVHAGLVVLAQDPIGQGERFSYYEAALSDTTVTWGVPEHEYAGRQCLPLGDAIARYFLHDAMRGVDYLMSRPEVDGNRIGVTGNSGGGTQTSLMMLGDPRIAAAAPTTFLMNRQTYMYTGGAQDAEQIWPGFTAKGFDHEDIVLAMAPKPVRALAVTSDFFPIEGTRRTVQRCRRIWELMGKAGDLDLVEDFSTHAYTRPLARAAAQFFSRHLLGEERIPDDSLIAPVPSSRLWCTQSGQVRGEIEGAEFVHEENLRRLEELKVARQSDPQQREKALAWLKESVLKDRKPCDLNPRFYVTGQAEDLDAEPAFWWSQEGLLGHGCLFRRFERRGQALPVTVAVWHDGVRAMDDRQEWIRAECASGRAVLVLDVAGSGGLAAAPLSATAPEDFYGVLHKLADDLFWLDDNLAALRTYDVLRALDMIAAWPGLDASDIRLYAHGREGVYGQFAALIDDRIRGIEVADGIGSYESWVGARHYNARSMKNIVLRGMLRYFDLPEMEK